MDRAVADRLGRLQGESLGSYRLDERIGEGSVGVVYRGTDLSTGRTVAVKVFSPALREQHAAMDAFRRALDALTALQQGHVLPVLHCDLEADWLHLVTPWVAGGNLAEQVGPDVPAERVLEWLEQLCSALALAHTAGATHGDLKPENILIDPHYGVLIADWGVAILRDALLQDPERQLRTSAPYLAPERARAYLSGAAPSAPGDARADVYAIGALAYYLVAGRPPFGGDSVRDILFAQVNDTAPSLAARDARLLAVLEPPIRRALAKAPTDRYPDVAALLPLLTRRPHSTIAMPTRAVRAAAARAAAESGDYQTTLRLCEQVLRMDPNHLDALQLYAWARGILDSQRPAYVAAAHHQPADGREATLVQPSVRRQLDRPDDRQEPARTLAPSHDLALPQTAVEVRKPRADATIDGTPNMLPLDEAPAREAIQEAPDARKAEEYEGLVAPAERRRPRLGRWRLAAAGVAVLLAGSLVLARVFSAEAGPCAGAERAAPAGLPRVSSAPGEKATAGWVADGYCIGLTNGHPTGLETVLLPASADPRLEFRAQVEGEPQGIGWFVELRGTEQAWRLIVTPYDGQYLFYQPSLASVRGRQPGIVEAQADADWRESAAVRSTDQANHFQLAAGAEDVLTLSLNGAVVAQIPRAAFGQGEVALGTYSEDGRYYPAVVRFKGLKWGSGS
jgi:serine/threonine protein kinase